MKYIYMYVYLIILLICKIVYARINSRYGRKTSIIFFYIVLLVGVFLKPLAPSYHVYALGQILVSFAGNGGYLTLTVYGMYVWSKILHDIKSTCVNDKTIVHFCLVWSFPAIEVVSKKYRSVTIVGHWIVWSFYSFVFAGQVYIIRHQKYILLLTALVQIPIIFIYWWVHHCLFTFTEGVNMDYLRIFIHDHRDTWIFLTRLIYFVYL